MAALPNHIIPYHTIPYHTIPYHTIPYHTNHPYFPRSRAPITVVLPAEGGRRDIHRESSFPPSRLPPYHYYYILHTVNTNHTSPNHNRPHLETDQSAAEAPDGRLQHGRRRRRWGGGNCRTLYRPGSTIYRYIYVCIL
jgi:hypothetical protein